MKDNLFRIQNNRAVQITLSEHHMDVFLATNIKSQYYSKQFENNENGAIDLMYWLMIETQTKVLNLEVKLITNNHPYYHIINHFEKYNISTQIIQTQYYKHAIHK